VEERIGRKKRMVGIAEAQKANGNGLQWRAKTRARTPQPKNQPFFRKQFSRAVRLALQSGFSR
jgi:hypothetical protein